MGEINVDWKKFTTFFNDALTRYKSVIPPITFISKGKRSQITRLLKQVGSENVLYNAALRMIQSDLCNGRVRSKNFPNGWLATFPWMLSNDEIIFDLVNGKYDNPPPVELTEEEKRQQAEELRQREAEERRRKNLEIDRQIREEQRRAREEAHANRATPEQLEEIFKNFKLPSLPGHPKGGD